MSHRLHPYSTTWAFSPMITSMNFFGLIWPHAGGTRGNPRWRTVQKAHCVLVCVLVAGHAGRFLTLYGQNNTFGPNLMMKAVIHVWSVEKLLIHVVLLRGARCHLRGVFTQWERYKRQYEGVTRRYMRHTVTKVVLAANLMFLLCSICGLFFLSLYMKQMTRLLLTPLYASGCEIPLSVSFTFYTFYFYLAFCWLQPILLLELCCFLLRKEFQALTRDMRRFLSHDEDMGNGRPKVMLESFRRRHDALCGVVRQVDDLLGLFCLVIYGLSVPLVCMMVFTLFYSKDIFGDDPLAIVASVVCLLVAVLHVIVITVTATSLATAAKSPKRLLFGLDLRRYSVSEVASVQTFLVQLTSEHLGLTLWKLLNIDRHLFVTLCAVVVSYVLILFKFSLALGERECQMLPVVWGPVNTTSD